MEVEKRTTGRHGLTLLHGAAIAGHRAVCELLVRNGADIEAKSRSGYTPLHIAAVSNKAGVVEALALLGASVEDALTSTGNRPLHTASLGGHASVITALARCGADLDSRTAKGCTALYLAVLANQPGSVLSLVEAGAAPEEGGQGLSPLHLVRW
jgi:ankyrin repeat protein